MGGLRWNFLKHSEETVSFGGEQKRNPSNLSEINSDIGVLLSSVTGFWFLNKWAKIKLHWCHTYYSLLGSCYLLGLVTQSVLYPPFPPPPNKQTAVKEIAKACEQALVISFWSRVFFRSQESVTPSVTRARERFTKGLALTNSARLW